MNKWIIIGAATLGFIALLTWLFIESSKPLPGEKLLQDGRDHVDESKKVDYKFNPPTSGDHFASWISKGMYAEPRKDEYLIHSLEHGYIIIWYNCEKKVTSLQWPVRTVYAQAMTKGSTGTPSAQLKDMPKAFSDGSCDGLKGELEDLYNKLTPHKLIVMPRVGMEKRIILTSWGRMLKLDSVNEEEIKRFVNAFRDNGPEHTLEP